MKSIIKVISVFLLLGSASACASEQPGSLKTPWDKWYFAFTTPKALPAQVTLLKLIDVANGCHCECGYQVIFSALDGTIG